MAGRLTRGYWLYVVKLQRSVRPSGLNPVVVRSIPPAMRLPCFTPARRRLPTMSYRLSVAALLCLAASAPRAEQTIHDEYWDYELSGDPFLATTSGDYRLNDRVPGVSELAQRARLERLHDFASRLQAGDRGTSQDPPGRRHPEVHPRAGTGARRDCALPEGDRVAIRDAENPSEGADVRILRSDTTSTALVIL